MSGLGQNPPYYITAYGLACKAGFKGTLEEWLESLTAFYMAQQAGFTGTKEEWIKKLVDPLPRFEIGEVVTLEGGSLATVVISGTKENPVLNFGIPRGLGMDDALPYVGGTMRGAINMNDFGITNLPTPKSERDAVPKTYADQIKDDVLKVANEAKREAGTAKNAAIDAATAARDAASEAAAAQKTAEAKAEKESFEVILTTGNWNGNSAPYTQTVAVEGILASDEPHWGVVLSGDTATKLAQKEAFANVDELDTAANSVTFTCLEEKPAVDLTIQMEVIR